MPTDINVSQLVINKLTQAQFNEAQAAGNISESELYFITDDAGPSASDVVSDHNADAEAHADIREAIPTKAEIDAAIAAAIEAAFANIARAEEVAF